MRLTDEQIGAELQALRETPSDGFTAELDRRMSAGFPVAKTAQSKRELTWPRLLPVLGGLAAVALVAVVISNSGGEGEFDNATSGALTEPSQTNGAVAKPEPNLESQQRAGSDLA